MWIDYTYDLYRALPMPKVERAVLPPESVQALIEAAEQIQEKFKTDPELRDLYSVRYSQLLAEIAANVKEPEKDWRTGLEKETENKA
jgi:hypothetical protein